MSEQLVKIRSKYEVQIPCKMYSEFHDEDLLLTLAYYVQLRTLHKKPIIYRCNRTQLAKKLGVSYDTLNFHLRILESKKIVEFRYGNFHMLTKGKLRLLYPTLVLNKKGVWVGTIEKSITIFASKDIAITKASVRCVPFLSSLKYQQKRLRLEAEKQTLTRISFLKQLDSKARARLKKLNKYKGTTPYGYLTASNFKIGKLLDRKSPNTVRKYRQILKDLKLLNWRRRFELIPMKDVDSYFDGFLGCLNGARIHHKTGLLIREVPCQFKLKGEKFLNHFMKFRVTYSSWDLDKLTDLSKLSPASYIIVK